MCSFSDFCIRWVVFRESSYLFLTKSNQVFMKILLTFYFLQIVFVFSFDKLDSHNLFLLTLIFRNLNCHNLKIKFSQLQFQFSQPQN